MEPILAGVAVGTARERVTDVGTGIDVSHAPAGGDAREAPVNGAATRVGEVS